MRCLAAVTYFVTTKHVGFPFHFIPEKQKKMKQPFIMPSDPLYRKVEPIPESFYKVCAAVNWRADIRIQTVAQHRGGPGGLQVDITFNGLWQ